MDRKEREKKIVECYKNGDTCTSISKKFSIQRKSVYLILKRNNVELRKKININCCVCKKEIVVNDKNHRKCGTCSTKIRRYLAKKECVDYLGGCCKKCNWSGDLSGYDFHHVNPSEKKFCINALNVASRKWSEVKGELDKCELLCALCHRKEHSDYQNVNLIEESKLYKGKIFK